MKAPHFWLIGIACIALVSCHSKPAQSNADSNLDTGLKFAKNFSINKVGKNTLIKVYDPTDLDNVFISYLLYSGDKPAQSHGADITIKVPVKSVAALSTTHIGFLDFLGQTSSIKGITDPFRVFSTDVQNAYEKGKIKGLGDGMDPNIEMLFILAPDIIFKSAFGNIRAQDKKLEQAKIPIAYSYSWKENHILARMEWIKFFACFYQEQTLADSLFEAACQQYDSLKLLVENNIAKRPQVIAGSNFKGTWYVPGGASYIASMIKDAGGEYIFENDSSVGSLTVDIETIYENGKDADFWVNGGDDRVILHAATDSRMKAFKPIENGNMYSQNLAVTPRGGNAYWESGIVHPQWILADLIKIFHPHLLEQHQFKYYKKVSIPEQ